MSPGSSLKISLTAAVCLAVFQALMPAAWALDQYPGDTVVYGASTQSIEPNVLIILDNSGSMDETIVAGDPYDPDTVYPPGNGGQGEARATIKGDQRGG